MFVTNNKLIDNIAREFNIEEEEANNTINNLFGNITLSILNGKKFHMNELGIISIDYNYNVVLSNNEKDFDDSIESINNNSSEKSIYESILKNISKIIKEEEVHIENFGSFNNSNITFKTDPILKNIISIKFNKDNINNSNINNDDIIKKLDNTLEDIYNKEKGSSDNEEVVEDILDELGNKINTKNIQVNDNDDIVEIVENNENSKEENDDSIDNNVIGNIWKNKSYKSVDINSIVNKLNNNNIQDNNDDIKTQEQNTEDDLIMKEYTKEELLDINNFDRSDLEDAKNNNNDDKKEAIEYMEEERNIHSEEELLKNRKNINQENYKNDTAKHSSSLLGGIVKVIFIIIFILIIGLIISKYYNSNTVSDNSIENKKLYDIVNSYFNERDSVNLSYITSKDMYYWDIAKSLYGDATYWPLIYSYNSDSHRISNIIRKGSSISYRSMPSNTSVKDIKYLNNTLSKSYISIYPILINDKKFNHALWALKLSAYYDLNVFKNNASIIPEEAYTNILKENNIIKNTYSDIINKENIFTSFIETIKQKLGITK